MSASRGRSTHTMMVFVSHAHEDDAFCRAMVDGLRGAGADVWYDEHNMGSGQLMTVIQRELGRRPVVVVILSRQAFASSWVQREVAWAYELMDRDPTRLLVPITGGPIERDDFDPQRGWLFLHDFKRIEAPGMRPYPTTEAIRRLLYTLALTPAGEAPAPEATAGPQLTEIANDLLERGKALMAQQKYAEALPLFKRATELVPRSLDAWTNLGRAYGQMRQHEAALDADEHALALDAKQVRVWNNKGYALHSLHRYDEALAAYDHALALDPFYAAVWNNKGNVLVDLKRYDEALAAYDHALALDPSYAKAWYNKGFTLRTVGRIAEAEAADRRAKELGG